MKNIIENPEQRVIDHRINYSKLKDRYILKRCYFHMQLCDFYYCKKCLQLGHLEFENEHMHTYHKIDKDIKKLLGK